MIKEIILLTVVCGCIHVNAQISDNLMKMRLMMMLMKGMGGNKSPAVGGSSKASTPASSKGVSSFGGSGGLLGGLFGGGGGGGGGGSMFGRGNMLSNMLQLRAFCDPEMTSGEGLMSNCMMFDSCSLISWTKFRNPSYLKCRPPGMCCFKNLQIKMFANNVINKR